MNTKVIAEAYTITSTLGAQFEFDGVPSFVTKAIPLGGTEEETFVLPYARCWNDVAFAANNHLPWSLKSYLKKIFKWGPLNLPVPKGSFFDAPEGWAIRIR